VKRLKKAVEASTRFDEMLGASPAIKAVFDVIDRVAPSDATVLVSGETGTGKELVARALHARGRRKGGPFVAINCGAVPEALLESELFGHLKGAFTGAHEARKGLFLEAHGGTLFLDEVGELPLGMQTKLLRALEQRAVRPVGGASEVPFDARIVAATNRDLPTAVTEGRFREDLYYRLSVLPVELPSLRARGGDILLIAQSCLETFAARSGKRVLGLSAEAAGKLVAYAWPGNVRELKNTIERAVALARFDQVVPEDLPEKVRAYRPSTDVVVAASDPSELVPLEEVERRYILKVFAAVGENKTLAARILGLDRKTLHRKLEAYQTPQGPSTKTL
jgi:transcriptional regulator with PAS, ATPase and Fis domain